MAAPAVLLRALGILALASLAWGEARAAECAPDSVVPLALADGTNVSATLRICGKGSAAGKRLPVVLLFGGFENAARVLDLITPTAPIALASFDYPFSPPRQMAFPDSLRFLPEAKRFIHQTQEGIKRLVDALSTRPELDPGRISIIGASFGSPFALAAAGSDPRLKGVIIVHGFADVVSTASHRMTPGLRRKFGALGFLAPPVAWTVASVSWWYVDGPVPEVDATKLTPGQKLLLVTADHDQFIPRESTELLWTNLKLSRAELTRMDLEGGHLVPGANAQISDILRRVEQWMRQKGLL